MPLAECSIPNLYTRKQKPNMQTQPPYAGTWEVPDGTTLAWGARLIIDQDGHTDLLHDRQGATEADSPVWPALSDFLRVHMVQARMVLSQMLTNYALSTREDRDVTLYEDEEGVIRGNPRASAGYCYVVAYLTTGDAS